MQRSRKVLIFMSLLLAGSLLTACGPKTAPPAGENKTPAPAAAKKPAVGGELILIMEKDPDNFNSILSTTAYGDYVYSYTNSSLFEYTDKWEPKGHLAESWSFSPDNKTMTIKLRPGVKFHDGSDLTADDVVFTFKSIMDKDYTGPRRNNVKYIQEITAVDKTTVRVDLKEPNAAIFSHLITPILSKKAFEGVAVKDFDKAPATMKPMGSGPYKFVEYVRGQYVTLERNDNWFAKDLNAKEGVAAPFPKTVRYKIIPESATQQAALENGEVDVHTPEASAVGRMEKDMKDKFTFVNYERNGFGYISFNVERPHLNIKEVRQALDFALDKQSVIDGLMDGRAVIPAGPIPPVSWAYDPSIKARAYDVAKAKELIAKAGYKLNAQGIAEKDGQPLKLGFYASSGNSLIEGIALIAKKNWLAIGVDLDVQLMDFNAMMENYLKPGKFDVSFSGFTLSLDPDQSSLWHSTQVAGFNRGRYNSPKVDQLLEQGVRELDQNKRKPIYSEFQKVLQDDTPAIFVYANKYTDTISKKVKGGIRNFPGTGATDIYGWWVSEQ